MINKQDRQGARTPADLERKYKLGELAESVAVNVVATRELQQGLEDFAGEYAQTSAEMQDTLGKIEDDVTINKQELVNAKNDILDISADLVPLSEFSDGTYSGIAGFVARANANATSIEILLEYAQGEDVTLATFLAEAAKEFATITALANVDTKHTDALAGFKTEASKTYATIAALASFEDETSEAISGVRQEASKTYATIEALASLETEVGDSIAGVKAEADVTYAKLSAITELDTKFANSLAAFGQEVSETYATQEMVASLDTEQSNALAAFGQKVSETYATQEMVTAFETAYDKALVGLRQEVYDGYVGISQIAEVVDKDGNVTISSIVQKINDGKSSVLLSADSIDLSGYITVKGLSDGTTEIDGACIKTGTIMSKNNGMQIDLDNSTIMASNFTLNSSGTVSMRNAMAEGIKCVDADVSGKITSNEGYLGSVQITGSGLTCGDTYLSSGGIRTEDSYARRTTLIASGVITFDNSVSIYAPTSSVLGAFLGVKAGNSWRTLYFDEATNTVKFV